MKSQLNKHENEKKYSTMHLQALQDLRNGIYYQHEGSLEHADLLISKAKYAFLEICEKTSSDLARIGLIEAEKAERDLLQLKHNMACAQEAIRSMVHSKMPGM